ncbi:unnamed protein product [Oikopleura dioica]|uniref:Uncharacterized protein n=1 Tax=Oikopleura dioica TaxID=34765 RepID=E4YP21_OIKDI|nr:unnamed protein product [Oikopleura dioica]
MSVLGLENLERIANEHAQSEKVEALNFGLEELKELMSKNLVHSNLAYKLKLRPESRYITTRRHSDRCGENTAPHHGGGGATLRGRPRCSFFSVQSNCLSSERLNLLLG